MPQRAALMVLMALKSPLHRLRHDLGREIVVLISSVIFIGTFLYVFEDFLNVQVASLSPKLRWWMAATLQVALSLGTACGVGLSLWRQHRDTRGLEAIADFLGEEAKTIVAYRRIWWSLVCGLSFGVVGLISHHWLVPLDPTGYAVGFIMMMLLSISTFKFLGRTSPDTPLRRETPDLGSPGPQPEPLLNQRPKESDFYRHSPKDSPSDFPSPVLAMTQFRKLQIHHGKPQVRWGILLSQGIVAIAAPACLALTHSAFLAGIGGLLAGLILSTWFAAFIAEDLAQSWTEKGTGVHHNDYIKTLEILSWHLIQWPLIISILLTGLMISQSQSLNLSLGTMVAILPAALTGAIGTLLLPWVVLQIDGKKPAIPVMTVTIMGLFVGSAMLAHPLGIVLMPLIRSFALNHQQGRFYRS